MSNEHFSMVNLMGKERIKVNLANDGIDVQKRVSPTFSSKSMSYEFTHRNSLLMLFKIHKLSRTVSQRELIAQQHPYPTRSKNTLGICNKKIKSNK